jgi:ectoine hydroxylase-related dioxygenase (phytanoyl-CoA dioxygenase family)
MVNLLQVSSAFGRAMETVNRTRMVRRLYATLRGAEGLNLDNVIAATAEGYPFPTNLDANPPVGGMAPKTQADYLRQALAEGQSEAAFFAVLDALDQKNQS